MIAAAAKAASRTLVDIIRDEEGNTDAYRSFICSRISAGGSGRNKISWKFFRGRLLLRRSAEAWISSPNSISISADFVSPVPAGSTAEIASHDNPDSVQSGTQSPTQDSVQTDLAAALAVERQQQQEERGLGTSPARVSLMALMEQTDTCTAAIDGEGEVEEVIEEKEEKGKGGVEYVCCVCMVRQKGAAFIPCGHTFCRVCSRELWISRGSCPLCNASVQEVLDIF